MFSYFELDEPIEQHNTHNFHQAIWPNLAYFQTFGRGTSIEVPAGATLDRVCYAIVEQ